MTHILENGPENADHRLIIAHGAGAGITSPFLEAIAAHIGDQGIAVTRFEFAYMAARRDGGPKRPPPKAEKLTIEYADMIASVRARVPERQKLYIGGKSLGGRVASLIADEQFKAGAISGLVCLGYPFHAPAQPLKLRTAHLEDLSCPALIVQGTRDPFGRRDEVEALKLAPAIQLHWIGDGDHDFGPRGASGFTRKGNLVDAAAAVAGFIKCA
ncbi:MAG: alpha/beta hydrolase [Hyphomicrobium sp.]|nr:alpha/beta hydrolase [Hyphomicrobium sp.]